MQASSGTITWTNAEGEGGPILSTISAYGTPAVQADSGGSITLTPTAFLGNVNTTGDDAPGLFVTDPNSTLTATGVVVTTGAFDPETGAFTGTNSVGLLVENGGSASFSNGSITTLGPKSAGVLAEGIESSDESATISSGASVTINGATTIETYGDGSPGLAVNGAGASLSTNGVIVEGTPSIGVKTNGDNAFGAYNGAGSGFSTGGMMSLTNTTIVTFGTGSDGVVTNSGGVTTISGGSVTTSGDNAIGLYASGAGSSITTTNGTVIVTGAPVEEDGEGDYAAAASSTFGAYAYGVEANGGAHVSLTDGSVTTNGDNAYGLYATGSGSQIGANNVAVSTAGFQSAGVLTTDGAKTNVAGGSIATTGDGAYAVVSNSGGLTTLSGTSISTTGNGSGGLGVNGAGSEIDATSVTITTKGGFDSVSGLHAYGVYNGPYGDFASGGVVQLTDTSVSTARDQMYGVFTSTGGATTILRGSVSTSGAEAIAILTNGGGTTAVTDGSVSTSGVFANAVDTAGAGSSASFTGTKITATGAGSKGAALVGTGSSLSLTDVTLSTSGGPDAAGHNAIGVYTGSGSSGLYPGGGSLTIKDSSISTSGFKAAGVVTQDSGNTSITGGSVGTKGNGAYAIVAQGGGFAQLNGTTVSTTGDGSGGFAIHGSGSEIDATGVTISTTGGFDSASGYHAYGLANTPFESFTTGGVAKLTDSSVSTQGAQMFGVFTSTGGVTTVSGGSVNTSGLGAIGVVTNGGGVTNMSGASVATSGQDAHALAVTGSGSQANLSGTNTFTTLGYGAIGLYVTQGGVLAAIGQANVTTSDGVSPATGLGAFGINADGAGSKITLGAATITTSGVGATGLFASDALGSGAAGSITATGALNVQTTNPAAAAVALQGNGASILATGGGSIVSAGNAIAFLGGSNQIATFDNFTINNAAGDLVFADPSAATVNFNNTTADAGAGNLLDATAGSFVTLNGSASTLTGAIQTDATSTSAVNLAGHSLWTMTGSSVVSNLSVTNSAIVFAPPGSGGGFKTLTLGSYVGSGASLTMNTTLGGSGSPTDQIVINGGQATGSTTLFINNVGGAGAQTTGAGIPIILATNGGSIAHDAFTLANPLIVNGYRYALSETDQAWYLVSSPTSTVNDIANSFTNIAKSQQQQLITNRVLTSILLGATEQINCSNCSSGFGSIGSYSLGAHGRWGLSDNVTLIGGFSYGEYSADNATVSNAPTVAGSIVYDFVNWGRSRPFLEAGAGLTPYSEVSYTRSYVNGYVSAVGHGKGIDRNAGLFGRVGWIDRLTPIDEAAVYADISRNWMSTGGYSEAATGSNPYPATVQTGLDTLNIVRVGGQYTHLFFGKVEGNISAAVAYGFDGNFGSSVNVYDFGTVSPYPVSGNSTWVEYGARIGYRLKDRMVLDAFVVGTFGGQIGTTAHGGLGLRYMF
ncbi:MAG TPA: hypothetical protein VMI72_04520 [Roseiarcus sp.]|nr:hypothetical protein [Roseiarcus sp.]